MQRISLFHVEGGANEREFQEENDVNMESPDGSTAGFINECGWMAKLILQS